MDTEAQDSTTERNGPAGLRQLILDLWSYFVKLDIPSTNHSFHSQVETTMQPERAIRSPTTYTAIGGRDRTIAT